jgi:chlorobactene glucosyltransferase
VIALIGWAFAAGYFIVFLLVVRRYVKRRPRLADYTPLYRGPLLSVIIPARNEALNIEGCVRSILTSRYRPLEIIVVDDRSSDNTADIVQRLAQSAPPGTPVRLVRGAELPGEGWFGKQWALVQGWRQSRGELLLFADADTRHEPELLPRAVSAMHSEQVDLFTVVPRQEMGSFWERLIQPHVFFVLGSRVGDLRRVNRTRIIWDAIANGQFIMMPRASYEAIGTHEVVRATVAEDLALAQTLVGAGRDIFLAHAPDYMATRMYRSLEEIVDGWSKNLALGAPLMAPPIPLLRKSIPYVMWMPALLWIIPPLLWAIWGWWFALFASLTALATWIFIYHEEQAPLWYALLYPLGAMMVAVIMIRSAIRGERVEWRGRQYGGETPKRRDA